MTITRFVVTCDVTRTRLTFLINDYVKVVDLYRNILMFDLYRELVYE